MFIFSTQQNWLRMWPLAMMNMSMWRIFLTKSAVPLLQQRRIMISFIMTVFQTLKIWILLAKPPWWNPPQSMYPSARSSQVGLFSRCTLVSWCFLQSPPPPSFLFFPSYRPWKPLIFHFPWRATVPGVYFKPVYFYCGICIRSMLL